jgi:hypothetical protein
MLNPCEDCGSPYHSTDGCDDERARQRGVMALPSERRVLASPGDTIESLRAEIAALRDEVESLCAALNEREKRLAAYDAARLAREIGRRGIDAIPSEEAAARRRLGEWLAAHEGCYFEEFGGEPSCRFSIDCAFAEGISSDWVFNAIASTWAEAINAALDAAEAAEREGER